MNKAGLAFLLAERTGVTNKQAEHMVETITDIITEQLVQEQEVVLAGFGTFSARHRHARRAINPSDKKTLIDIPAIWVAKFKTGRALKDAMKKKGPSEASA